MQASRALAAIADAIAPYVGQTMAQSSIDMHRKSVGIVNDGSIDADQIDELLRRLALGLNIFIGRDKTTAVLRDIRSGMEGLR